MLPTTTKNTPTVPAGAFPVKSDELKAKAAGQPTATLEAEIDTLVAARYGLTPTEAAALS